MHLCSVVFLAFYYENLNLQQSGNNCTVNDQCPVPGFCSGGHSVTLECCIAAPLPMHRACCVGGHCAFQPLDAFTFLPLCTELELNILCLGVGEGVK